MLTKVLVLLAGIVLLWPLDLVEAGVTRSPAMEKVHQQREARQKSLKKQASDQEETAVPEVKAPVVEEKKKEPEKPEKKDKDGKDAVIKPKKSEAAEEGPEEQQEPDMLQQTMPRGPKVIIIEDEEN